MNPAVSQWLQRATEKLQDAADEVVNELAADAAQMIGNQIPANRTRTRRAVKAVRIGLRHAAVGLFFANRYTRNKRSVTYESLAGIWRGHVRPRLRARLVKKLNQKLKR